MSPGPVSDSYDPEFGTGQNAADVAYAIETVRNTITAVVFGGDSSLKNIVDVVQGKHGRSKSVALTEAQWRVVRFCLNRALESI